MLFSTFNPYRSPLLFEERNFFFFGTRHWQMLLLTPATNRVPWIKAANFPDPQFSDSHKEERALLLGLFEDGERWWNSIEHTEEAHSSEFFWENILSQLFPRPWCSAGALPESAFTERTVLQRDNNCMHLVSKLVCCWHCPSADFPVHTGLSSTLPFLATMCKHVQGECMSHGKILPAKDPEKELITYHNPS